MTYWWLVGNEGISYVGLRWNYIPLFPANLQQVEGRKLL